MSNNPNQPRLDDAVLGGQTPPMSAAILGGLEGVKRRLASKSDEVKIAALKDALSYGTEGLKFLDQIMGCNS
jgi:hypothetical protein